MSVLTIVIVIFSILGAIDYVIGNKFGLGKFRNCQYEKKHKTVGG